METNIPTLRKGIFYLEHIYYLLHSSRNDNLDEKAVTVKNIVPIHPGAAHIKDTDHGKETDKF